MSNFKPQSFFKCFQTRQTIYKMKIPSHHDLKREQQEMPQSFLGAGPPKPCRPGNPPAAKPAKLAKGLDAAEDPPDPKAAAAAAAWAAAVAAAAPEDGALAPAIIACRADACAMSSPDMPVLCGK